MSELNEIYRSADGIVATETSDAGVRLTIICFDTDVSLLIPHDAWSAVVTKIATARFHVKWNART